MNEHKRIYLKFMPYNTIINASRNYREIRTAAEYGFDVIIYSCDSSEILLKHHDEFNHICCKQLSIDKNMIKLIRWGIIIINSLRHIGVAIKARPDVISCENLRALFIASLAYALPFVKRPQIIYDAHEYEIALHKNESRIKQMIISFAEKKLIKKCAFSIMINDGIADAVQKAYKIKNRPIVVRSIPNNWDINWEEAEKMHDLYCDRLNIPRDSFITMYQGHIMPYRGLEEIIGAMSLDKTIYTVIMGNAQNEDYYKKLLSLIENNGLFDRILFLPEVDMKEIVRFTSGADCGFVLNNADNPNYYYALPNKFFENIQSAVPFVCSDLPEMSRIVRQYDIAILVPYGKPDKIVEAVTRLRDDKDLYKKYKENLLEAKKELCWNFEKKRLIDAFNLYL